MSVDPRSLRVGDVVLFGRVVRKTVGSITWKSPSGHALISFGSIDSWHYDDDPLWQIAELAGHDKAVTTTNDPRMKFAKYFNPKYGPVWAGVGFFVGWMVFYLLMRGN